MDLCDGQQVISARERAGRCLNAGSAVGGQWLQPYLKESVTSLQLHWLIGIELVRECFAQ